MSHVALPASVITNSLEKFEGELELFIDRPPGGDAVMSSFGVALRSLLNEEAEDVRNLTAIRLREVIALRGEALNNNDILNLLFRGIQSYLLERYVTEERSNIDTRTIAERARDISYLELYRNSEAWRRPLGQWLGVIDAEGHMHYADFQLKKYYNIQSTVANRYQGILVGLGVLSNPAAEQSVLDVGCSANQGLKQLALLDLYPFEAPRGEASDDNLLLEQVNKKGINLGRSAGIDIFNANDPIVQSWIESCSFRPNELHEDNASVVQRYYELLRSRPPYIDFLNADMSDAGFTKVWPYGKVQVGSFLTMLYQVSQKDRRAMFNNVRELLDYSTGSNGAPNGVILVQDCAERKPGRYLHPIDALEFDSRGFNNTWRYNLHAWTPQTEEFVPLASWDSGRCRSIRFADNEFARSAVAKLRQYVTEPRAL